MGKNRDFLTVFTSRLFWKLQVSEWEFKLTQISETLSRVAQESSNLINRIPDRQESELQALDVNFDDDLSLDDYTSVMKQRQQIENEYQRQIDQEMARANTSEKFLQQQQTSVETRLQVARANEESCGEFMNSVDCSYFGNS